HWSTALPGSAVRPSRTAGSASTLSRLSAPGAGTAIGPGPSPGLSSGADRAGASSSQSPWPNDPPESRAGVAGAGCVVPSPASPSEAAGGTAAVVLVVSTGWPPVTPSPTKKKPAENDVGTAAGAELAVVGLPVGVAP